MKELEVSPSPVIGEDEVIPPTPESPVRKLRVRRRLNFDKPLPKLKLNLKSGTSKFVNTPPKEIKQEDSFELIPSPEVKEVFRSWTDAVRGENPTRVETVWGQNGESKMEIETEADGEDYDGSGEDPNSYSPRLLGLSDYIEMIETCEDLDVGPAQNPCTNPRHAFCFSETLKH